MKGKKGFQKIKKTIRKSIKTLFSSRNSRFLSGGKKYKKKTMKNKTRSRRSRSFRGGSYSGYSQYQNNLPMTPNYSLGGNLPANLSALANPPPYQLGANGAFCTDNYNHFTNKGSPSPGH